MILNLTQHVATPEQVAEGVVDLAGDARALLVELLTFDALPDAAEIADRAHDIAQLVAFNGLGDDGDDPVFLHAMIGGASYLMAPLEAALRAVGVQPLHSFSPRESVERVQEDGSVRKVNIFRHTGFVPAAS